MEDIKYKLDSFEGPLDLLLTLIKKNKVSIWDIPIVEIGNCCGFEDHSSFTRTFTQNVGM